MYAEELAKEITGIKEKKANTLIITLKEG